MTTYVATWYQIAEQMLQIRLFLRDTPMKWDPVTKRTSIRPFINISQERLLLQKSPDDSNRILYEATVQ